jgi:hypothetical protein
MYMKTLLLALTFLFSFATTPPTDTNVYICDSPNATVYHQNKACSGLQRCKHEIKLVTLADAQNIYGRRACKICY